MRLTRCLTKVINMRMVQTINPNLTQITQINPLTRVQAINIKSIKAHKVEAKQKEGWVIEESVPRKRGFSPSGLIIAEECK